MTPGARERIRVVLVLLLLGAWALRWTTAQTAGGATIQHGPARTGFVAVAVLLATWGLSATALVGRASASRVRGARLTDALLAAATAAWLALGGAGSAGSGEAVVVFASLALLALLEALLPDRDAVLAGEVVRVRGGAAIACAVLLGLDAAWLPAGVALWLGGAALLGARGRRLEALLLFLALAALLTPTLGERLPGVPPEHHGVYEGHFAWLVVSALLLLLALRGLLSR